MESSAEFSVSLNNTTYFFTTPLDSTLTEPFCDAFGKQHCSYKWWSAWLFFALGLLLMFTNLRNLCVLVYILRRHWVNTEAICCVISGLNAMFGTLIVVRSVTTYLRDLWPPNQFVVCIWSNFIFIMYFNLAY